MRHSIDPQDTDGGVTAALIEKEAETPAYTAEDFARAEFARHPDGRVAARMNSHEYPWGSRNERNYVENYADAEMARDGWAPVQEERPLTAREHLDAAWAAARAVTAGTAIAPGVGYITRYEGNGELLASVEGHSAILPARGIWGERRLLDPPAPARPEWADARAVLAHVDAQPGEMNRVWENLGDGRWRNGTMICATERLANVKPLYPRGSES